MAGTIKGILVKIGGDTSGLQKAISKVNTATSSLSKELRGVNSLLKLDPRNIELVSQKQKILAENIEATSKKLEELKKVEEMANSERDKVSDENYRNLQREIANTEYKLKQLQVQASKWTKAGESLEEFSNKVTRISDKIDGLGSTLTTGLTLPIFAIGTAATTVGNEFEAKMSKVQAIAGATKEELEKLTETAIELGSKTSFSSSQVAEGMENLASAGFDTNEIIKSMPGLLDLAASSGTDLARAAEITASAIRGFGLEANTSAHIADVFAEAAARTNAQTEDMGEAMKYVAPVAKTVGLSIEETAAAIGIMSDAGVKGSQAGTTLRGGLTRIVKPTKVVKEAMEELGVEFYNSNGTMKSLTEIIQTLQEHTKGLTDETKNQALAQIFGTEALSGMLALVNRGSSELESMTKSFKECDGAAAEMAETMLDNTAGSLESLSGSFESAGIAIQKALSPQIRDLAKWIQGLVDDFTELSEEEQQNIVKNALLVASIGPAVKILGKLGKGIGSATKSLSTFTKALAVVRAGTTSADVGVNNLAKVFQTVISPVGVTITATIALAGAFAYMNQKAHEIPSTLQYTMKEMENYKKEHKEFREEIDKAAASSMAEVANIEKLKNELSTLVDENGRVKDGYKDRVAFILKELNEALGTEYSMTGNVIKQYKNLQNEIDTLVLKKKAQIVLENEEEKYSNALANKEKAYQKVIEAQKEYNNALNGKTYEQYFEDLKKNYEEAGYTAEGATKYAQSYMAKWVDGYKQNYEDAKQIHSDYLNDIAAYENDYAIIQSGNNEKIQELIRNRTYTYKQESNDIGETINHNIQQKQYEIEQYRLAREKDLQNQDFANAEKNKKQIEAGQKEIETLAQQLVQMTSTTEEMTPQLIEAWKNLANDSYSVYSQKVSQMSPEMQQKIQETTGVIAAGTPQMQVAAEKLGQQTVDEFDKSADAKQKALNTIQGYLNGLEDEQKREFLKEAGVKDADLVIDELNRKDLSEESGKSILEGLWNGLKNNSWQNSILGVAKGLASSITSSLSIRVPKISTQQLPGHKTGLDYVPYDNYIARLHKGERVLTAKENKQLMNMQRFSRTRGYNLKGLSQQVSNRTNNFTINFYPQKMTESEMERAFTFIDKKYGRYVT